MFLLGFHRKLTALALCKSIESAIQWFQIHHRITFATMQNPAVYLSGARVSIFSTLVPRLYIRVGYNLDIMRQSACLVFNTITVYSYSFLFNFTMVGQASDSMTALT